MHAVPRRHREGRQADECAALGRAVVAGADAGHERRLDLRPGPGCNEPGQDGPEAFPRGSKPVTVANTKQKTPADLRVEQELASEEVVEMANLTSAQTGVPGTIFISTAMGPHGPRVKYFLQPGRTQPSFSVSIADAPAVVANSLPVRVVRQRSPQVIEWVSSNKD